MTKEHIRHVLLYEFSKVNNITESARNINAVYGDGTLSISQCQRRYQKFRAGNYSVKDEPYPERSVLCRAQRERPAHLGGTKSYRYCSVTSREAWIWSFNHSSTPTCYRKSLQFGSMGSSQTFQV